MICPWDTQNIGNRKKQKIRDIERTTFSTNPPPNLGLDLSSLAEIALKLRRDEGQDFFKIKLQFFKVKAKGYYMLLEQLVD